jgi:para-aminobenzoate synthetase/4-amino-4-deoxychorismate lyase
VRVIEARFDDLMGGEASFRLVEPVGVLEATRCEEVVPTIAAAEAAATRGLWVAGFVAYEAAPGLDPSLRVRARDPDDPFARLPLAWFALFEGRQETSLPDPPADVPRASSGSWMPSVSRSRYDAAIAAIHERIAAGETYQVNHTFRLRSRLDGDERGFYRDLCFAQRGAHAAYLNIGRYRVLSASPELFFRIEERAIVTRPMKGTAPRGRWLEEDAAIRERLRGSVKDRAENAMIVDLLRNDLARVARDGTVTWTDVFEPERYETVWQLTSTVAAELRADVDLPTVFRALFPCGSVTGAPKVSTMGIIAELEDAPRGVYCGTVGYLAPPGAPGPRARFNVAIRTATVDVETRAVEYGVGGGITWDSSAVAEYAETVAKAAVLTARRPPFRLIETLAHEPETGYRRLEEHLARLEASASYFGFFFDGRVIRTRLDRDALHFPGKPSRVRLLLERSGRVETGVAPMPASQEPVVLAIDRGHPVDPADPFLFHKTTRRDRYEEARARFPDADDVVLVNRRGEVTETSTANLAAKIEGGWWTPPTEAGLLAGCERAALLDDGTVRERSLTPVDIVGAESLAVLSSVRGWRRAVLADGVG